MPRQANDKKNVANDKFLSYQAAGAFQHDAV